MSVGFAVDAVTRLDIAFRSSGSGSGHGNSSSVVHSSSGAPFLSARLFRSRSLADPRDPEAPARDAIPSADDRALVDAIESPVLPGRGRTPKPDGVRTPPGRWRSPNPLRRARPPSPSPEVLRWIDASSSPSAGNSRAREGPFAGSLPRFARLSRESSCRRFSAESARARLALGRESPDPSPPPPSLTRIASIPARAAPTTRRPEMVGEGGLARRRARPRFDSPSDHSPGSRRGVASPRRRRTRPTRPPRCSTAPASSRSPPPRVAVHVPRHARLAPLRLGGASACSELRSEPEPSRPPRRRFPSMRHPAAASTPLANPPISARHRPRRTTQHSQHARVESAGTLPLHPKPFRASVVVPRLAVRLVDRDAGSVSSSRRRILRSQTHVNTSPAAGQCSMSPSSDRVGRRGSSNLAVSSHRRFATHGFSRRRNPRRRR